MSKYLTCNCTLPDLNPGACRNCRVWQENQLQDTGQQYVPTTLPYIPYDFPTAPVDPYSPWVIPQQPVTTKKIKRVTRTIERYDELGNYKGKEVITEDSEDIEVPQYSGGWITTSNPLIIATGEAGSGTSTTTQKNVPFTYTSNTPEACNVRYSN